MSFKIDLKLVRDILAMFPDYSAFKIYHRLTNRYAILVYTTNLLIGGTGTAVYTIDGCTILTCNPLHITALRVLLYSLCKHRQRPGCGVYSSYKDSSYVLFLNFILQVEDSYEKKSATGIWAHHIKAILTAWNLGIQSLQP